MTKRKVIAKLKYFNKWRRGADIKMPIPAEIGETIDEAIKLLEKGDKCQYQNT